MDIVYMVIKIVLNVTVLKSAPLYTEAVQTLLPTKADDISNLLCSILSLGGDVHLMFAHNLTDAEVYREDMTYMSEHDTAIVNSINKQLHQSGQPLIN